MYALGESKPGANALDKAAVPTWPAIAEAAKRRLRRDMYLCNKQISCEYYEGVLILRGCVPSYYMKQVAQSLVADIEGVQDVDNKIEVAGGKPPRKAR